MNDGEVQSLILNKKQTEAHYEKIDFKVAYYYIKWK